MPQVKIETLRKSCLRISLDYKFRGFCYLFVEALAQKPLNIYNQSLLPTSTSSETLSAQLTAAYASSFIIHNTEAYLSRKFDKCYQNLKDDSSLEDLISTSMEIKKTILALAIKYE